MKNIIKLLLFMLSISNFYLLANSKNDVVFTNNEQRWLDKQIPVTYVYDIDWAPFEWKNDVNRHSGVISDILNIISQKSNIKFEAIHTNSWAKAVLLAQNNKVDMYSAIPLDTKRAKYMNFTSNNIFQYNASLIKNKNDKTKYKNLDKELSTKTIAIIKSSSLGKFVKKKYPQAKYIELEKTVDGFKQLQDGKIDLFAINSATAEYMINIKGYKDLKVLTKLEYTFNLKIAISKTMPKEVLNIIDKTLGQIDKSEIDAIYNKWTRPIKIEKKIDWIIIIYIFVTALVAILFLVYRQYLLQKQKILLENKIENKTKDLKNLNKNLQKKIEEKTKEQTILIESLPIAIQGYNKNREVIYWNKKSEDIYGYSSKEAINRKLEDLIIPDFMKDDVIKAIDNLYNNGVPIPSVELPLIRQDGSTVFVYSSHIMIKDQYSNLTMFCMDIDLTMQKELQEKDKLIAQQTKMVSMGEMIGNIAHQWRQPLSVISTGATGLKMQKEYGSLTNEFFNETCDAINNNAQYLSKTIDDFKDFIKGDGTKNIFSLESAICSFLNLVNGSIKNHNINIVLNLQKNIQIDGYENELTQCLINIFNNAKDILEEKEINDKFVFISTSANEDNAIIKIKDNGGGIPKDIIDKIFEPYFTTKHQSQGTGIGLHMTYNLIVDGMNGTIEADNAKYEYNGKNYIGAEFIISLPIG